MKTRIQNPVLLVATCAAALMFANSARAVDASDRQCIAKSIRDDSRITLDTFHSSGITDSASTARQNIIDAAAGYKAKTSYYSDVGTISVWLDPRMLDCMKDMAEVYGYSFRVSEVAGGDHSSGSYHYSGTAFDVYIINGVGVSASNPYYQTFLQRARDRGAVEALGPGYPGHDTHIHMAWSVWSGNCAPPAGSPTCATVANYAKVATGPIAYNNDGRQEVFINGRNSHRPWHAWQTAANGSWSGFSDMGSTVTFKPGVEVGKNADGRVEIFAVGTDNAVYHNCQKTGGGWTGWMSFGGNVKGICVAANQDGRMELFQIGAATGYVWHKYQTAVNGAWSDWFQLGSTPVTSISAIQNKDGRLELFGLGTDTGLRHIWQGSPNGAWGSWANLGGSSKSFAVARNTDGRLEAFAIGNNTPALWHIWQDNPNGAFGGWSSLGGANLTKIAVGANKDGRLEVFGLVTDTSIWHLWQRTAGGAWVSGWSNLGGSSCSLAVGSNQDGRLEVFAVGNSSKSLWHIWQGSANGGFGNWADMGGCWEDNF